MSHHGACVPTSIRSCVLDRHSRVQRQHASGTKTRRRGVSGHRVAHRRLFRGASRVNVNATDATAGVTALLLPAQNTHTLLDPI
jgi:hypothetical protein